MSAPEKLSKLCIATSPFIPKKEKCGVKHRNKYVDCTKEVVYKLPLSCGRPYIGQTGRCLNHRLREHANRVEGGRDGNLAIHCHECGCKPLFQQCTTVFHDGDQRTREIVEAAKMQWEGSNCVSMTSVLLTQKEMSFLEGTLHLGECVADAR